MQQTYRGLLCSLVYTIYAACPEKGTVLETLFQGNHYFKPTYDMLKNVLKEMLSGSQDVYLIMDALDECRELDDVLDLIQTMRDWNLANCHVLVTSRREQPIAVFFAQMGSQAFVELDLANMPVDNDIQAYIAHELAYNKQLQRWGQDGCHLIHKALTEQANGMFRWVACQLDELKRCSSRMEALNLNRLPKTLKETYDNILERIPEWERPNTTKLLMWLTFACSPLTLEELASVLEFDDKFYNLSVEQKLLNSEDVFLICSSLIKRTEDDKVALAHASVKEYLLSNSQIMPDAKTCHAYIATMCIKSLDLDSSDFLLGTYCSKYWPSHIVAGDLGLDASITEMIKSLFMPEDHGKQLKSYEFLDDEDYLTHIREPGSPLVYAALLGVTQIVRWLLETDWGTDVDLDLNRALLAASHRGHIDIVLLLLNNGANVHATHEENNTSAFQYGVYKRHLDILKLLLERGVDINQQGWMGGTALHSCAMYGHMDILQFLINNGAMVNIFDKRGLTPLHCASGHGHILIIKLLLMKGADPNKCTSSSGAPLHQASFHGNIQVVQCLLDNGACINLYSEEIGTPLQAACVEGHFKLVKVLIERGADINKIGGNSLGNALHAAIHGDHIEIASYLIEKGAHIMALLVNGRSHLHNAVSRGNSDMVKLLCKHGGSASEFLEVEGIDGTPLEMAFSMKKFIVAEILLENGAKLTAEAFRKGIQCATRHHNVLYLEQVVEWKEQYRPELDSSYTLSWALADASFDGDIEMVKILLEKYHVDANALDGIAVVNTSLSGQLEALEMLEATGATSSGCEGALQAAACVGNKNTLEYLLSLNGSDRQNANPSFDINYYESNGHSALEDALIGGYPDIARMLIEMGADVNGQKGREGVALKMAACRGYADVVKMILDKGIMNGFQAAFESGVSGGWIDVVRVMLEDGNEGRNIMIGEKDLRHALHVARQKGFDEIVEMLERENGQSDGEDDSEVVNDDGETKDEQSALLYLTQKHHASASDNGGMLIEGDADRNASANSEGATGTLAGSGTTRAGMGLLAYTLSLFHL